MTSVDRESRIALQADPHNIEGMPFALVKTGLTDDQGRLDASDRYDEGEYSWEHDPSLHAFPDGLTSMTVSMRVRVPCQT